MQCPGQIERRVSGNEKEYICFYDLRNHRRHFICTRHVHGADPGVERISTGRRYGNAWRNRASDYGTCMEKNGEQRADPAVGKDDRRNADRDCRGAALWHRYVPYDGMEPYGRGYRNRNRRYRGSSLSDSIYQRLKVKRSDEPDGGTAPAYVNAAAPIFSAIGNCVLLQKKHFAQRCARMHKVFYCFAICIRRGKNVLHCRQMEGTRMCEAHFFVLGNTVLL